MKKTIYINFFRTLLMGLLILAMILLNLECLSKLAFWIVFAITLVAVIFLVLQIVKVSKQYDDVNEENVRLKAKIRELEVGKLEDFEKDNKKDNK